MLGAVAFVASSLRRPEPPVFAPSAVDPRPAGDALVGPALYTIDASHERAWRHFDFSSGSRVDGPGPLEWDLAFRRNRIIVNGGVGFAGQAGAADLGAVDFETLSVAPEEGYRPTEAGRDSVHSALDGWYDYGFTTHVLMPKPTVYAIRTADGRYAKLEIVSYYCPGARAGCTTFRYVYQGDGSRSFRRTARAGRRQGTRAR
ncbi:MAG TPA: HmuY family protein [Gemmatimonadota bacterium]|nr:HmuY family protein [Gemmatimonadota bacterium]